MIDSRRASTGLIALIVLIAAILAMVQVAFPARSEQRDGVIPIPVPVQAPAFPFVHVSELTDFPFLMMRCGEVLVTKIGAPGDWCGWMTPERFVWVYWPGEGSSDWLYVGSIQNGSLMVERVERFDPAQHQTPCQYLSPSPRKEATLNG